MSNLTTLKLKGTPRRTKKKNESHMFYNDLFPHISIVRDEPNQGRTRNIPKNPAFEMISKTLKEMIFFFMLLIGTWLIMRTLKNLCKSHKATRWYRKRCKMTFHSSSTWHTYPDLELYNVFLPIAYYPLISHKWFKGLNLRGALEFQMNFVGSKEVVLLDCERTLNNELTKNKQEDGKYHTCPCLTMLIVPSSAQQLNLLKKLLHYLQLPIMRTLQEGYLFPYSGGISVLGKGEKTLLSL